MHLCAVGSIRAMPENEIPPFTGGYFGTPDMGNNLAVKVCYALGNGKQ